MDTNQCSPVLTDPAPCNKSRLGIHHSPIMPYSQQGATYSTPIYITIPTKKKNAKVDDVVLSNGWLEDVRSNGWLDAMKSSSPPRKKALKEFNPAGVVAFDDTETAYSNWMSKHPSAIRSFEKISESAKKKKIVIFLDYDGTLSPIVDDPDRAFLSDDMRFAVRMLAKHFPTAIVTGRSRDMVYGLVGLAELHYAGSHGMDIMGPVEEVTSRRCNCVQTTNQQGKEVNLFQPAKEFLPMIDEVFNILVEVTKGIKGSKVENHKFCCSVHYRNVDERNWPLVAQIVHDALKNYPRLRLTHGRKVLEIRPVIDWNKGKAVEFLLQSLGLSNADDVLPVYIGDDRTDEDAFEVLKKTKQGFGILVSSVPKETKALYSLRDTTEVMQFLKYLVRWKEDSAI